MLTCYGRITDAIWSDFEDLQDSDKDPVVIITKMIVLRFVGRL